MRKLRILGGVEKQLEKFFKKKPRTKKVRGKFEAGNDPLSHTIQCSIMGAGRLNFCVRDENRCGPSAIITGRKIFQLNREFVFKEQRCEKEIKANEAKPIGY